jgi:opacity protein-like surface antigen
VVIRIELLSGWTMRAIIAAAFALMLVSPACASDYYSDVAYDWTGVYGGVHAGFIQANINVDGRVRTPREPGTDILDLSYERDFDGFVGGALGGVNFQAGSFVFGLDMDFGGVVADGEGTEHVEEGAGSDLLWIGCWSTGQGDWPSRISMSKATEACRAITISTMAAMPPAGVPAAVSNTR